MSQGLQAGRSGDGVEGQGSSSSQQRGGMETSRSGERPPEMGRDLQGWRGTSRGGERSPGMERDFLGWRESSWDGERPPRMERELLGWREISRDGERFPRMVRDLPGWRPLGMERNLLGWRETSRHGDLLAWIETSRDGDLLAWRPSGHGEATVEIWGAGSRDLFHINTNALGQPCPTLPTPVWLFPAGIWAQGGHPSPLRELGVIPSPTCLWTHSTEVAVPQGAALTGLIANNTC